MIKIERLKVSLIPILLIVLSCSTGFGQQLKCKKFKTGTFIIPGDSIVPQSTIKRSEASQIEFISATDTMELDVEWIDECNYVLKINKSVSSEDISEVERLIEAGGGLRIKMLKTSKDTLYFRATATIKGVDYPKEGKQIKISKKF